MKVYKFGGASVGSALGVKRLADIVKSESDLVLIVSAMGKMTNAFEDVVHSKGSAASIDFIRGFHMDILNELFPANHTIFEEFEDLLKEVKQLIEQFSSAQYDFLYDQIVSYGELISTKIISAYLNHVGLKFVWKDARKLIRTDEFYREAKVDWKETESRVKGEIASKGLYISQGFIGGSVNGLTTTLGREGSDYSAAIFAYCLNLQALVIWKDVDGVLNADPRHFKQTQLLHSISYAEAIEMAFYGASVIHPKTLKPLENKHIPLQVKSFLNPNAEGTTISSKGIMNPEIPCYILKKDQVLISVSARDFSFIVEDNIRHIFETLHEFKLQVNLIQNSALEFVVCVTDKYNQIGAFEDKLQSDYHIKTRQNLELITIRHFHLEDLSAFEANYDVVLKQRNDEAYQIVANRSL